MNYNIWIGLVVLALGLAAAAWYFHSVRRIARMIYDDCEKYRISDGITCLAWLPWRGRRLWRAYRLLALHQDALEEPPTPPPPRPRVLPEKPKKSRWILFQDEYIQNLDLRRNSWFHELDPEERYWIVDEQTDLDASPGPIKTPPIRLLHAWINEQQGWVELWFEGESWNFIVWSNRSPVMMRSGDDRNQRDRFFHYMNLDMMPQPLLSGEQLVACGNVFTLVELPEENHAADDHTAG